MKAKSFLPGIIALLLCSSIQASLIHVPTDYPQIQQAILASVNSDTVVVAPGTYYENINFRGKRIVLTSRFYEGLDTTFISSTIINGSQPAYADTASCVIFNSGEDSTTVLQGFTLTGGSGTVWADVHGAGTYREGGGVLVEFSSPLIQYNVIHDNIVMNTSGVLSTGGGGIRCGDGNPTLRNNVICHNQGKYGCGVVFNYCNGTVVNNLISYNSGGQSYGGGGLWATGVDTNTVVRIENNTISNNSVTGTGSFAGRGGALLVFSVKLDLFNNILWGNTQSSGSCIAVFTPGVVRAQHSDIEGGFPGISNLNVDPFFANSSHFLLSIGSPCIDAGIPGSLYFDPESEALGTAAFPSLGTLQNDMGVYGGQGSFLMPVCTGFSTGILSPSDYANFSIDAFPNPTNSDHVKIRVSKNPGASGLLTLSDFSGREVFRRTYSGDSLVNGEDLELTGFQNGVYTIRYTGNNLYRDLKFMILR